MKNPFKRAGFDSLISAGTSLTGSLHLEDGSTTIIDGTFDGIRIDTTFKEQRHKGSTLVVGGSVNVACIDVQNLTITGAVTSDFIRVQGLLSIKAGASIMVVTLEYNELVIENGAKLTVTGSMSSTADPKTKIQTTDPEVQ